MNSLTKKKNKKTIELKKITFFCISCKTNYQTTGLFANELERITNCSNCSSAYIGGSVKEAIVGSIDKFYQRAQKNEEIKKKKEKKIVR